MSDMIERLVSSLAHTTLATPRPMADLEIPADTRIALDRELSRRPLKPAAVLVGIVPSQEQPAIVLTRRSEALKNHPGQISFPGGRREEGDADLMATALRESEEEIALPVKMVDVIGYLPDYPTITGYRVTPVVGVVDPKARLLMQPDGLEATELIYLPLPHALDRDAYDRKMIERNGLNVPVFHLHHRNHHVWGATAGMLYQLCLHLLRHEKQQSKQPFA